ncbi:MAG: hypothetical protein KME52_07270 [Desmonostoc geniculatum HA4340-LM1]|jgi:hypothetical protein|nr:hypothetical protein [Desmonostoc geniculatum HA4340-LM1]
MPTQHTHEILPRECRFCSLVSKASGEDLIGTAGTCEHWLIMEVPQPWPQEIFQDNPTIKSVIGLFQELISQHEVNLKPMLIAPDREYSHPGFTRVFYYYRPAKLFSQFEKQEFIVPESKAAALLTAIFQQLMQQPNDLSQFQQYQQQTSQIRELMVCTHAQAEREIWMQSGWSWLNYLKTGKVLAMEKDGEWAEVEINFALRDGSTSGTYEARVEVCSEVMTAFNSTKEMELEAVKQYRVSRLVKVE